MARYNRGDILDIGLIDLMHMILKAVYEYRLMVHEPVDVCDNQVVSTKTYWT